MKPLSTQTLTVLETSPASTTPPSATQTAVTSTSNGHAASPDKAAVVSPEQSTGNSSDIMAQSVEVARENQTIEASSDAALVLSSEEAAQQKVNALI